MKKRLVSMTPVTDYTVTQKIRTALIDSGHTDLAAEQISEDVRELEEKHATALERIDELEKKKVTESGVHRIITEVYQGTMISLGERMMYGLLGAIGAAALAGIGFGFRALLKWWLK